MVKSFTTKKRIKIFGDLDFQCVLIFALALFGSSRSEADTQAGLEDEARAVHHQGKGDSEDECETHVFMALMDLSALNIGGAISNGYHAYGNYLNSQKMNNLGGQAKGLNKGMDSLVNTMQRAGAELSAKGVNRGATDVSGSSKFVPNDRLYQGELGKVAAEFEQRSGMKREEVLAHLKDAHDHGYRWDDPNLASQMEARYNQFAARIPNADFRAGLEKAAEIGRAYPKDTQEKFIGQATDLYNRYFGDTNPATAEAQKQLLAKIESQGTASSSSESSSLPQREKNISTQASDLRKPASVIAGVVAKSKDVGLFIGLNVDSKSAIADYFQDANIGLTEESIFDRVNKKYRSIYKSAKNTSKGE